LSAASGQSGLVDIDDLVEVLEDLQCLHMGSGGLGLRFHQLAREHFVQGFNDQSGLTAAGDARDAGKGRQRDFCVDILQIVAGCALQRDLPLLFYGSSACASGISISRSPISRRRSGLSCFQLCLQVCLLQ
jgi:hypothetical protein